MSRSTDSTRFLSAWTTERLQDSVSFSCDRVISIWTLTLTLIHTASPRRAVQATTVVLLGLPLAVAGWRSRSLSRRRRLWGRSPFVGTFRWRLATRSSRPCATACGECSSPRLASRRSIADARPAKSNAVGSDISPVSAVHWSRQVTPMAGGLRFPVGQKLLALAVVPYFTARSTASSLGSGGSAVRHRHQGHVTPLDWPLMPVRSEWPRRQTALRLRGTPKGCNAHQAGWGVPGVGERDWSTVVTGGRVREVARKVRGGR